jgi:thiamine biosynthesis lipoprotein
MRRIRRLAFWAALLALAGCAGNGGETAESGLALGTVCTVRVFGKAAPEVFARVWERLRQIDELLSAAKETSALSAVNRQAGIAPLAAPPELLTVLERALDLARLSGGAFDPTVGPLVRLWGISTDTPRVPSAEEIAAALPLVDYTQVLLDRGAGTVFLARPGMALDLGGIAKGFAADEAAAILRAEGIRAAIIDLGGNIAVLGARPGGRRGAAPRPWRVGIQDPDGARGEYLKVIDCMDTSVVTSGVYERFFESGGIRYHHILSTETGYPVRNGLASVTVITPCSMDADALSTALFALGEERGRKVLAAFPGASAEFVYEKPALE